MALLHNRISRSELKEKIALDNIPRSTISFYHYFEINEPQMFRDELYTKFSALQILGRVYIASEGVNAQISIPTALIDDFKQCLQTIDGLQNIHLNIAIEENQHSFYVLKIKVRPKIVADGIEDKQFNPSNKGKYVDAKTYNEMCTMPNTIVVDMRNHYEYEVGHFKNAIEIPSDTFREQLPMCAEMLQEHKDKQIIMYCTGGIRCEKASAYLMHQGFSNVYHLKGGIINYTNEVKKQGLANEFIGKNFVFDDRLGERITNDIIATCHQCNNPCDTHTNCKNEGCHLLFIQCDECKKTFEGTCSNACKEIINLPKEQQKELRKGIDKGQMIFNKAKKRLRPRINS